MLAILVTSHPIEIVETKQKGAELAIRHEHEEPGEEIYSR